MRESHDRAGLRRVFGRHAVRAVIERRPEAIVAATVLARGDREADDALTVQLIRLGVPITRVARGHMDRLVGGEKHQGLIVEIQYPREFLLDDFEKLVVARGNALKLLVLDGVEDPRNLGACLRTADAAGIDAVVVPRSRTAKLTEVATKAATGAAETMPLLHAPNLVRMLKWLQDAGVWILGTDADASQNLYETTLVTPVAVVLGGEGRGLRRLTRETCDQLVAIPMAGVIASLNVSVATGVVLFELLRQCPGPGIPGGA